jgi:hypothetical protein
MKKILISIFAIFFASFSLYAENLIKNGDFLDLNTDNTPALWQLSSSDGLSIEGIGVTRCVKLTNGNSPKYLSLSQTVTIDSVKIRHITVKSFLKINEVVKGQQDWEMARIMVLFFDKAGTQVGGWPELGRWQGSFDWCEKINIINVPENAVQLKISIEMSNCTGTMSVRSVSVEPGDSLNIPRDNDDFLINGSMEFGASLPLYWGGWVSGAGSFESPGYKSAQCFKITNLNKGYSMITQQVPVDSKKISSVNLSGYVKVSGVVQGADVWDKARISIEFHNSSGERVDNKWPPVAGESDGDISDWTLWSKNYSVPAGTTNIVVAVGLLDCTGTIWFDSIKLTAEDKKGRPVKPEMAKIEDRSGWFPFTFEQDDYRAGAVLDFTDELDKPAGKHGVMSAGRDGELVFADGTQAKFWGTNIVGNDIFRSHEETDKMVKRLAKLGINMVRLHHMDAWWADPNIFQGVTATTRTLSPDSLDKLDYLIYKLKNAGIYIFMDMLVHRKPKINDGIADFEKVPAGFKEVIFFDEKLQDLTKEYITQLLSHDNPYTKTAYKDDNSIVMTEIVNESSLFYFDRNTDIPLSYREQLDKLFNAYLADKYKNMQALKETWDKYGDSDLAADESLSKMNIHRAVFKYDYADWAKSASSASAGRAADTKEFYYKTECAFFSKFHGIIRDLDPHILITGSNHWDKWDADLKANAALDFIDRHSYWDHPSGGWTMQDNITFTNNPMLKSALNCVTELAQGRIYGKPFTVSEYNSLIPNEYRAGFPVIMAAYSKLNGWDAMLQFNFSNYEWKNNLAHFADFSVCPDMISNWAPAVLAFSRGYVKTAPEKLVEYVSDADAFFNKNSSYKLINKDYAAPLMLRSYKTFDPAKADKKYNPVLKKGSALSLTQQLYLNRVKGIFVLNSEKLQGAAGFLSAEKDGFKFRNLRIKSSNKYASIFLASLDNMVLLNSSKILLNTTARMDNTGVKYSPSHTSVIYGGSSPILLEPVYSTLRLTLSRFKIVRIWTLDANNYKKEEYTNFTTPDKNTVIIKTDENSKTLSYYIEVERK